MAVVWLAVITPANSDENRPEKANWLIIRGTAYFTQKRMSEAIDDFTAAIALSPDDLMLYVMRGVAHESLAHYADACADFSAALQLDAGKVFVYVDRGRVEAKLGRYREALADFDTALAKNPALTRAYYAKAMVLACCPDDEIRDGVEAVRCATRGCELTNRAGLHLNALAAAQAEFGDWVSAVETQTEALRLAKEPLDRAECQDRLTLYQAKKPYRETADAIERHRLASLAQHIRIEFGDRAK